MPPLFLSCCYALTALLYHFLGSCLSSVGVSGNNHIHACERHCAFHTCHVVILHALNCLGSHLVVNCSGLSHMELECLAVSAASCSQCALTYRVSACVALPEAKCACCSPLHAVELRQLDCASHLILGVTLGKFILRSKHLCCVKSVKTGNHWVSILVIHVCVAKLIL